jgi:hypothetical protein
MERSRRAGLIGTWKQGDGGGVGGGGGGWGGGGAGREGCGGNCRRKTFGRRNAGGGGHGSAAAAAGPPAQCCLKCWPQPFAPRLDCKVEITNCVSPDTHGTLHPSTPAPCHHLHPPCKNYDGSLKLRISCGRRNLGSSGSAPRSSRRLSRERPALQKLRTG